MEPWHKKPQEAFAHDVLTPTCSDSCQLKLQLLLQGVRLLVTTYNLFAPDQGSARDTADASAFSLPHLVVHDTKEKQQHRSNL